LGGIINFSHGSLWLIADLLAVLWITWCMNITGWAAGIEGQLPGFVSISAYFYWYSRFKIFPGYHPVAGDYSCWCRCRFLPWFFTL